MDCRVKRAMILAAGKGSRLGGLTAGCPKPMLPVCGRPVLEWVIRWLVRFQVTDVVINLHHGAEVITAHFGDGRNFGLRIDYSVEPKLLGTAGGIKAAEDKLQGEPFFLIYGDNLTTCDLDSLAKAHMNQCAAATIALYWKANLGPHSAVEYSADMHVTRFDEKPQTHRDVEGWMSAGLAVLDSCVLRSIEPDVASDFGYHTVPTLIRTGQRVIAYPMSPEEGLWWIDTHEAYEATTKAWATIVKDGRV